MLVIAVVDSSQADRRWTLVPPGIRKRNGNRPESDPSFRDRVPQPDLTPGHPCGIVGKLQVSASRLRDPALSALRHHERYVSFLAVGILNFPGLTVRPLVLSKLSCHHRPGGSRNPSKSWPVGVSQ